MAHYHDRCPRDRAVQTGGHVSDRETLWPPQVGDRVSVKATGAFGEVVTISGAGETQRFLVDIQPQALEKTLHDLGLPNATAPERHAYRLEELSPQPPDAG